MEIRLVISVGLHLRELCAKDTLILRLMLTESQRTLSFMGRLLRGKKVVAPSIFEVSHHDFEFRPDYMSNLLAGCILILRLAPPAGRF
jgi:hypothetical protein